MSRTYEELSAKNELTITEQQADDGWGDAAAEQDGRLFRGTFLKFADRQWTTGKEKTLVEDGTVLVALSTALVWLKWVGKKLVDHRIRQPNQPFPERGELGDLDQELWEDGLNGEPRDPWQLTRFVYLVDPQSAEAFTFSNSSDGAHSAVKQLAEQIKLMRMAHPHATPVVELRWAPMQTRYGMKSKPLFKVVGWRGVEAESGLRDSSDIGSYEVTETPPKRVEPPRKAGSSLKADLDDDVPFAAEWRG